MFQVGQRVKVINADLLEGNDYGPEVKTGQEYEIVEIIEDNKGNQHLNVGLKSNLNYVRSFETKEELKDGHKIHWCHPSRFELV